MSRVSIHPSITHTYDHGYKISGDIKWMDGQTEGWMEPLSSTCKAAALLRFGVGTNPDLPRPNSMFEEEEARLEV